MTYLFKLTFLTLTKLNKYYLITIHCNLKNKELLNMTITQFLLNRSKKFNPSKYSFLFVCSTTQIATIDTLLQKKKLLNNFKHKIR